MYYNTVSYTERGGPLGLVPPPPILSYPTKQSFQPLSKVVHPKRKILTF